MKILACDRCHTHLKEAEMLLSRLCYSDRSLELCLECHRLWVTFAREMKAHEQNFMWYDKPTPPAVP